jgi:hypothetical protein
MLVERVAWENRSTGREICSNVIFRHKFHIHNTQVDRGPLLQETLAQSNCKTSGGPQTHYTQ